MAPWRPTVHVWPTLWNTKKNFHPNVQPVQFSSWYLPPFGFYGSLKKCHFSLPWEWFSLFPFSWGGGAPQTPSHIGSFDPLGVRNNQHPKKFFAPEPIFKLSQSAPQHWFWNCRANSRSSLKGLFSSTAIQEVFKIPNIQTKWQYTSLPTSIHL